MRNINTEDIFALARVIKEARIEEALSDELKALFSGKKVIKKEEIKEMATANATGIIMALITAFSRRGAEEEFYKFISGPFEMSVAEIKKQDAVKTLEMLTELASAEEWRRFFGFAAQSAKKMRK